jgi:hypothetical protein
MVVVTAVNVPVWKILQLGTTKNYALNFTAINIEVILSLPLYTFKLERFL